MPEQLSHEFVFARPMHENDCAGCMAKLMYRHPDGRLLIDPFADLAAQTDLMFGASEFAWKQPIFISAPEQNRAVIVHVLVDDVRDVLQPVFEPDAIFYVVIREDKPVVGVR